MERSLIFMFLSLVLIFTLSSCGSREVSDLDMQTQAEATQGSAQGTLPETEHETENIRMDSAGQEEQNMVFEGEQTEYISSVPTEYFEKADRRGSVIKETYESRDYTAGNGVTISKTAYVYLPHGYDEADQETKYDILYLMHGWTMTAGDFFDESMSDIVPMLDRMIENGDIPPVIVVCATFDAENQPQSFSRSVEELTVFHNDFRNDLMPYMEGKYHTYADGVAEEDLKSSRGHRAFGGFSLGAVTTWYQFVYNLDYVKYFVPMSGDCWIMGTYGGLYHPVETTEHLEGVVSDGGWNETDFMIFEGIGTEDPIWDQANSQIQEMMKTETFTSKNLHYAIVEGGHHDIDACERYLYHALQSFFGR